MEKITVTFLGTANAIPTEKRNHSGILVSLADENILFDCGEGIQRQFRLAKLSPAKITRIFISHWHGDHILGIPGLLQTLSMSNYQKKLHIYGPRGTKRNMHLIEKLLTKIRVDIEVHEIESGKIIDDKNFYIEAISMSHGTPALAYSLILKDKIRLDKDKLKKLKIPNTPLLKNLAEGKDIKINGKTIKASQVTYKDSGKKITIIIDTSMNENIAKIAKDSDLLISEATFSSKEKDKAKEYQHLTAEEAANIAKKSKSKKLILTHISQRYEHFPYIIEKEAKKIFKNTILAKDLDIIIL